MSGIMCQEFYIFDAETKPLQALFRIPHIVLKSFAITLRHSSRSSFILTHYTTLFFLLLLPSGSTIIFCQDIEWLFVPKFSPFRQILRMIILSVYARAGCIIFTTVQLQRYFSRVLPKSIRFFIHPIDTHSARLPKYDHSDFSKRDFDVLIVLRKSWRKNSELALLLLRAYAKYWTSYGIKFAVVNAMGAEINYIKDMCNTFFCYETLPHDSMLELYKRSRLLFFPSLHEGFGLPVLEAINAGCIPILFRNHGSSSFMPTDYQYYLSSKQNIYSIFCTLIRGLSLSPEDYLDLLLQLLASIDKYKSATQSHTENLCKLNAFIK